MGKIRQRAGRQACGECLAPMYEPCRNKATGKEIKGFHRSRLWVGKQDHLNREVRKIEGNEEEAELWQWSWVFLGLAEKHYPEKASPASWRVLFEKYPDIDPSNQYHGSF